MHKKWNSCYKIDEGFLEVFIDICELHKCPEGKGSFSLVVCFDFFPQKIRKILKKLMFLTGQIHQEGLLFMHHSVQTASTESPLP